MGSFNFADRYAEAGLQPSSEQIALRQAPVDRICEDITMARILDLTEAYFGRDPTDFTWFRDEFAKEDGAFTLVNNDREKMLLAASILGRLIDNEDDRAILAVLAGTVGGKRTALVGDWLIVEARRSLSQLSVAERKPRNIATEILGSTTPKLTEQIDAAIAANDWAALGEVLKSVRSEATASTKAVARKTSVALAELNRQVCLQREENQILWWLTGAHSRELERRFSAFTPPVAAIVGAIDLGDLTTVSRLGPVSTPAILERVIALAKQPKGRPAYNLATIVDSMDRSDLKAMDREASGARPWLAPISTAIHLAHTIGTGAWHNQFEERTGLKPTLDLDLVALAMQVYREHLLGQLQ